MQAKIYEFLNNKNKPKVLIVADEKEVQTAKDVFEYFEFPSFSLSDLRATRGDDLRSYKSEMQENLVSLNNYYHNKKQNKTLILPLSSALLKWPSKKYFQRLHIEFASEVNIQSLKQKIYNWGYEFVDVIEAKGEVSFRGDIVDIFPINSEKPYRISFFDKEVENITSFDEMTQRSNKEELESIEIYPAYFALEQEDIKDINEKIEELVSDSFEKDIASLGMWVLPELIDFVQNEEAFLCSNYKSEIEEFEEFGQNTTSLKKLPILPQPKEFKDISVTISETLFELHKDKKTTLIATNEDRCKNFRTLKKYDFIKKNIILNIISQDELIVSLNIAKDVKIQKRRKAKLMLDELKVGDYIVHQDYGIGKFVGIEQRTVLRASRDFLVLGFQNDDKLLIPVENLNLVEKYIGEGDLPIADRLGKGSFSKLKEKAKAKLFEIASEIIEQAAQRELIKAKSIINHTDLKEFQKDAGFTYTVDQKGIVDNILDRVKSGKVLDMLLSGDVGFGKTEIAMNAIFATVRSGFQAAFVVPTTLLCEQHFVGIRDRFLKYGIKVGKINRFVSAKTKNATMQALMMGDLDVCVGTHAMFGATFKSLGLVVVDEEHKFGVKQKEKLKELQSDVHVLSMSATPIPRSLNLALSQVKQYTQLLSPPSSRLDVRTFVKEFDEKVIKEAILREKRRGGQTFFVHNRIASIEHKKNELQELLPEIKILVLHSKVPQNVQEKEMMAFANKEYDILLSTSIIESGIHIPNVNTIIVEKADMFGMADLHQLRGRVGRGSKQGYCYYLVKNKEVLTKEAKKRLLALENNSFLGSGSVLAYHDLEIRGGGNILGQAQSGHIKGIGYSLYLSMLEEAINTLMGKAKENKKEVDIKLLISAYISSEYIQEDRIRLELYRRLSFIKTREELFDIEEEMCERFGKLDVVTKQFLDLILVKIFAFSKDIAVVSNYNQDITIEYANKKQIHLKSRSRDDDDLLAEVLKYLRK